MEFFLLLMEIQYKYGAFCCAKENICFTVRVDGSAYCIVFRDSMFVFKLFHEISEVQNILIGFIKFLCNDVISNKIEYIRLKFLHFLSRIN
jgi:hypothetical protein